MSEEAKVTETAAASETDVSKKLYPEQGKAEIKAETPVEEKKDEVIGDKPQEKAAEEKKPEEVKYELKLPEGSRLDNTWLEKISAEAKAKGFSQDQAQKLVEERNQVVGEYDKQLMGNFQKVKDSWVEQITADPDLGGKKLDETKMYAEKAFRTFAGSEEHYKQLRNVLEETGYGNFPPLVRWAANVGRAMSSDKAVNGEPKGPPPKTAAQKLYGATSAS